MTAKDRERMERTAKWDRDVYRHGLPCLGRDDGEGWSCTECPIFETGAESIEGCPADAREWLKLNPVDN